MWEKIRVVESCGPWVHWCVCHIMQDENESYRRRVAREPLGQWSWNREIARCVLALSAYATRVPPPTCRGKNIGSGYSNSPKGKRYLHLCGYLKIRHSAFTVNKGTNICPDFVHNCLFLFLLNKLNSNFRFPMPVKNVCLPKEGDPQPNTQWTHTPHGELIDSPLHGETKTRSHTKRCGRPVGSPFKSAEDCMIFWNFFFK